MANNVNKPEELKQVFKELKEETENVKEKSEEIKKAEKDSLLSIEDIGKKVEMLFLVANLVEIEEHSDFSYMKTGDERFIDIHKNVREIRSKYLKRIKGDLELKGDSWCSLKHIASAFYRSTEVAVKEETEGNRDKSKESLQDGYELYKLFWVLLEMNKDLKEEGKNISKEDNAERTGPEDT